jgi:DNA primase
MEINNTLFNADLESIMDELKNQLSINHINLFEKGFKTSGNSLQCQCPLHGGGQERKPSAGIRKSDGKFHCFACGEIRELPELISNCFGKDDMGKFGWQWLLKNFATVSIEHRNVSFNFDRNIKKVESKPDYVSESELKKYRWIHKYMYARGLTDEVIDLFDIGYDSESQCITFPVRDINGNCLFVARRSVKTKFFNYPEGVEKPLYGLYELHKMKEFPSEIIVCESMLDALTCWVYGKYAVALNGLGNDLQFKQLKQLSCRTLILATDNDSRGMEARQRLRKHLEHSKIIKEYLIPHIKRPDGKITKDINDLTREEFNALREIL